VADRAWSFQGLSHAKRQGEHFVLLYVEGRLTTRAYDAKGGSGKRYRTEIVARQIRFLGRRAGRLPKPHSERRITGEPRKRFSPSPDKQGKQP
jgi:single-stranded DNA-binding protein